MLDMMMNFFSVVFHRIFWVIVFSHRHFCDDRQNPAGAEIKTVDGARRPRCRAVCPRNWSRLQAHENHELISLLIPGLLNLSQRDWGCLSIASHGTRYRVGRHHVAFVFLFKPCGRLNLFISRPGQFLVQIGD
jgi:hypothetical protein